MKTRRQLRQKLGTRTSRRFGTKKGENEKPSIRLKRLLKKELTE